MGNCRTPAAETAENNVTLLENTPTTTNTPSGGRLARLVSSVVHFGVVGSIMAINRCDMAANIIVT